MKKIRLSIIGFGVIGSGVAKVISKKRDYIKHRHGIDLELVGIGERNGGIACEEGVDPTEAYNLAKTKEMEKHPCWKEGMIGINVIKEVNADIVIETTPTNIDSGEPGLSHMMTAFKNKRHVVTSNKGPLAVAYKELIKAAEENDVQFRFEASVGGAMPVFNLVRECLQANKVLSIKGILNGTCNYILTRMSTEGMSYEHALSEAQELGIAETNPSYDVEGMDTACKLVILANEILGMDSTYKDVEIEGITGITIESLKLASDKGYTIKLIGEVEAEKLRVAPRLVPKDHPLAVRGTLNVMSLNTDLAGEITITGKGAGAIETSSSILSDVINIAKR
ncbi:MAG: homoserine dehydrogenase [Methanocellales archaeon]|nr:homoserine dehydrogenase [Methanocellales archaeon]MDD3291420.1 homoserine dehydrogenase [Methanocellales archaeon]MDD5234690.1 homoserine dehydrogenase [Methanocellales archaeon]MDD5484959.1 homoserine dehydrogenase [Methanocellales archaeon]